MKQLCKALIFILTFAIFPSSYAPLHAETRHSHPEEIEWTWEVRPTNYNPKLPNVLLLGDSITRNYYPTVKSQLTNIANVYLMASSTSVGDPRLSRQIVEFCRMEGVQFNVIHFNNGMHGWTYSEDQYKQAFQAYLHTVQTVAKGARLIWASTTPVKVNDIPGPTNTRVDARNAIAKVFIDAAHIPIDDQHALMMHHLDSYQDTVHFNSSGSRIQGIQATATIRNMLASFRRDQ